MAENASAVPVSVSVPAAGEIEEDLENAPSSDVVFATALPGAEETAGKSLLSLSDLICLGTS